MTVSNVLHDQVAATNPSSAPKSKDSLSAETSVSIKAQNQDSQKVFKLALFSHACLLVAAKTV